MILKNCLWISIIIQTLLLQNLVELRKREEIDENILQKRCELMHFNKTYNNEILSQCIKTIKKPGKCPKTLIGGISSCLEECSFEKDYKCSGTKKCCKQLCGWICQEPDIDISLSKNLPPIPFNLIIPHSNKRIKKGRSCELSWEIPLNYTIKLPVYFVVEGRSHIGNVYSPHKLGEWEWFNFQILAQHFYHKTYSRKTVVKIKLRKARWYQFRVAAVNELGFKGYSKLSDPYRLSDYPKPPKAPKNFTLTKPLLLPNNTVYAKASWLQPKSDLPIEKYQISWALYLKSDNDSLYINKDIVKEPLRQFEFWNLYPNSLYYVQVQAIAINGKRRPKSPKESLMLNTTLPLPKFKNLNEYPIQHHHQLNSLINSSEYHVHNQYSIKNDEQKHNHPDIIIKSLPSKKYGMIIRIIFQSINDKMLLELCTEVTDCEIRVHEATKAKKEQIDFIKLLFNKKYTVRLIDNNFYKKKTHILLTRTFTTPKCEAWLKSYPNLNINC